MLKSLTVVNPKGESLKLELFRPERSGLAIQKIEGLGPSKADINTGQLASTDGSLFASARVTERNIVVTLAMLFSPTIEAARLRTYRFFPIKKNIKLIVETDTRIAEIIGYVESNEPDIFSEQETAQISIICPDPYFYEEATEETVFSGVQPVFEFPFSNESLDEDLLEFGEIRLDTRAVLNYSGDMDTGITITLHALGPVTEISLFNVNSRESIKINTDKIALVTGKSFDSGDDIILSTIKGNKYCHLLRNGVRTNIISAINKDADWFQVSTGENIFSFTAKTGERNLIVSFVYRNAYGGV